jgi:hypothetical protein
VAYLQCTLVGMLTGIAAVVAFSIVGSFLAFQGIAATGAGGIGAVSVGISPIVLLVWLIGFGHSFFVMWRRQRHALHPSR